jgi:hypothetical protein
MFVGEVDNGFGNVFINGDFVKNVDEFLHAVGVVIEFLLVAIGLGRIFDVTTDSSIVFVLVEVVILSFVLIS